MVAGLSAPRWAVNYETLSGLSKIRPMQCSGMVAATSSHGHHRAAPDSSTFREQPHWAPSTTQWLTMCSFGASVGLVWHLYGFLACFRIARLGVRRTGRHYTQRFVVRGAVRLHEIQHDGRCCGMDSHMTRQRRHISHTHWSSGRRCCGCGGVIGWLIAAIVGFVMFVAIRYHARERHGCTRACP